MSKSILTIDTPKGCVFCPIAKMHGFSAFHNYVAKQETAMERQPYMGISCPFCNGIRYIYDLTASEVLTYKHKECPLVESSEALEQEPIIEKIRAEIDKIYEREGNSVDCLNALDELKWFIDKYKAESEDT